MPSPPDAILQRIQTRADCVRCDARRIVEKRRRCIVAMASLKLSANSVAPYRLPSRHPSAGAGDRVSSRNNAHAGAASAASQPRAFAMDTASAIKRRQEALLIAYLVSLAR
jgi:hypothetical protein